MTDMRATERLLESIAELSLECSAEASVRIRQTVTDLRRRGDTLVRADDLRMILEQIARTQGWDGGHDQDATTAALDRLENALGGKMR